MIKKSQSMRWLAKVMIGIMLMTGCSIAAEQTQPNPASTASSLTANQLFRKTGADSVEDFAAVRPSYGFDVVNESTSCLMVVFAACPDARVLPAVIRLLPGARETVTLVTRPGAKAFSLSYAMALAPKPFTTHKDRYRAFSDGETIQIVPVSSSDYKALKERTAKILQDSRTLLTDPAMPPNTFIYTAGPFYRAGGLFARDFLYQLEGSARDTVTVNELKNAVEYFISKQLPENRKVGAYTYPKGVIPDHIYPDGRYAWGPGEYYGDVSGHFHRPSMDQSMCFINVAWVCGYKMNWDAVWQSWFKDKAQHFVDAWNSVPRNPKTGLVTQWTTPGHIGANGITETNDAAVMWGFHDSYGFGGDDVGVSVLACNAARALADMYDHAGDSASAKTWEVTADAMRDSIRAQFNPAGYLPWGVGKLAPLMASPDITGYAVWSGILTDEQADSASDWFADRYKVDKITGGAADLFNMAAPFRGAVRMARKVDDVSPGRHVWPDMPDKGGEWDNLAFGYNAYQDGGYWYYRSLGIAATLWRKHPDLAAEWVNNAYADMAADDEHPPYERIDGLKPVNDRYNASAGSLMGMGVPGVLSSIDVVIATPGK
jgi:hypothetical protein